MNVFHCCVQRTGSQWLRRFFGDSKIEKLTGLQPYNYYKQLRLSEDDPEIHNKLTSFSEPFPENTIVTPLYINFNRFEQIPKPTQYKTFFVTRDPRDLVVSWYFSTTYSHFPNPGVQANRERLSQLPLQEGLMLAIDLLSASKYFQSLQSWFEGTSIDPNVTVIKFEDLTAPETSFATFQHLFERCNMPFDPEIVSAVLEKLRFENLAKRKQGVEDIYSHYRKGIEGDWINYFDDAVEQKFYDVVGNLPYDLGYRSTKVDLLKKQLVRAQTYLQQAREEIQELQESKAQALSEPDKVALASKHQVKQPKSPSSKVAQVNSNLVARERLTQTTDQLNKAKRKIKRLDQKLKRTRQQLRTAKSTITAMESSKFWKLRSIWVRLLNREPLPAEHQSVALAEAAIVTQNSTKKKVQVETITPTKIAQPLPQTDEAILKISLAEKYVAAENFEAAIAAYQEALVLHPISPLKVYMGLGAALTKLERWGEAAQIYTQAKAAYPKNAAPYRLLGFVLRSMRDFSGAIQNFQQAVQINTDQPPGVYASLGEVLSKKGDYEAAITAYQKAIDLKSDWHAKIYIGLGEALRQANRLQEALNVYEQVLPLEQTEILSEDFYLTLRHLQLHFGKQNAAKAIYEKVVANRFLINHEHKIIYCPIQKNACSLLITMMMQISPASSEFEQSGCKHVHEYLYKYRNSKLKLGDVSYLQRDDYFKFLILRNPFDRLVSAYLDKFAKPIELLPFEIRVVEAIARHEGKAPDLTQGINFRQFIHNLARTPDYELDEHWRSQQSFIDMDGLKFDYIGQFEKINDVLDFLENKFEITIAKNRFNHITTYQKFDEKAQFHEMYPAQLRQLEGGFPKSSQIFTPELEALVRERYAKDIELYENTFGLSLDNYFTYS